MQDITSPPHGMCQSVDFSGLISIRSEFNMRHKQPVTCVILYNSNDVYQVYHMISDVLESTHIWEGPQLGYKQSPRVSFRAFSFPTCKVLQLGLWPHVSKQNYLHPPPVRSVYAALPPVAIVIMTSAKGGFR